MLFSFAFLVVLVQVWLLFVGLEKPVEFFPSIDPKSAYVNIDTPEGADLEYLDRIVRQVEVAIVGAGKDSALYPTDSEYQAAFSVRTHKKADGKTFSGPGDMDNVEHVFARSARATGGASNFQSNLPNHVGIQFLDLKDRDHPSARDLEEIRRRVRQIAGVRITVDESKEGPPTGAPINIEISGDDFRILGRLAGQVESVIAKVPVVEDIRNNYVASLPSIRVRIDRQRAALFGLSTNMVGFALKTAYNGLDVSTYREGDDDYDIVVRLAKANRNVTDVLRQLMIPTPTGQLLPLTAIAAVDYVGNLGDITRVNHKRTVTVKANVDTNRAPAAVVRARCEKMLAGLPLPPGYQLEFTGESESQQESQDFLVKAFMIAVFLIFLTLVTLFNSVAQPLIIMTSVILSLGGVFLGLTMIRSPFGIIMSGVGVISLAGVVVNNAIVLIDYTNKLRERGYSLTNALVAAGATRLRPVLLTAVTTVLGLIPMVTGVSYDFHVMAISWVSESTQWWRTMAIVVIYGLLIATFLTLVVVPVLYSLIVTTGEFLGRAGRKIREFYWRPYERWAAGRVK